MRAYMRMYKVRISALHDGKAVEFMEIIAFPFHPREGCPVPEEDREEGAVQQVKLKYPNLLMVRAVGSIRTGYNDREEGEVYLPFPL